MKPDDVKVALADLPWAELGPGAREKRVDRLGARLRLLELASGFVEEGWCVRGHTGLVLEGRLDIDLAAGGTVTLDTGDAIRLPAGEGHRARPLGRARLFLVEEGG